MSTLQRHIPELALEWAKQAPLDRWRAIDGTLCYADISGFTAMAEQLAQRGRVGGEELVETLSWTFSQMLDIAHARGGSLVKFGGDALLLFFPRDVCGDAHAIQAASSAVEMRKALRKAADISTLVGPLQLSISVGLHSGSVDFFLVGASHRELIILGRAANKVIETEGAANAHEIVVSTNTADLLPKRATKLRGDGELLLRWRKAPVPALDSIDVSNYDESLVRSLFPAELANHLARGAPDPEHRVACIAFLRFSGTDTILATVGPSELAQSLQATVACVQDVLIDEGVTLLAIDFDNDGGKFFLVAGVPYAHEDDEGTMLRALRRIMDADLPLPLQAGVNRGHVFAAEVGTLRRAAFSAMGDTTNTAARITAQTPVKSIYTHPAVLDECLTRFDTAHAGPLTMKGKTAPQFVYRVGEALGLREREGLRAEAFIGREAALLELQSAVANAVDGRGGVISVVGETGLGKTRLLEEATRKLADQHIIRLRAEPYGANSPYRIFRDAVRSILGIKRGSNRSMRAALERSVAHLDPALCPWLPLIGDVAHIEVASTPEVDAIEPEFRPNRLADTLIAVLTLSRPGLVTLTVDDTHWCDEASAVLLGQLEKAAVNRAWLVLLTRRDTDSGHRAKIGATVNIGPMPNDEIRHLVQTITDAAPLLPAVAEKIVERAAGYPLFAIEIVRAVREFGSLDTLPESLEATLTTQVDTLDRPARRLLGYGAVLGHSFSLELLEELLVSEGHGFDAGILARLQDFLVADGEGRLRFRNGLLRDTIYSGLSYRLRNRLHRHAGVALEARSEDPQSIADTLAVHFSRGEDYDQAWRYALLAGHRAKERYANADAARDFEIALTVAGHCKDLDSRDILETWMALGETRELARRLDDAFDAYRRALRLTRHDPVGRAELMYKRAWAKYEAGLFSSALRDITTGSKLLIPLATSPAERKLARLEALRAGVYYFQDRPRKAVQAAEKAIGIARASKDKESLVRSLWVIELANVSLRGPGDGHHLWEAMEVARAIERPGLQAVTAMNFGVLDSYAGRWDQAVQWFTEAHTLFAEVGNDIDAAYCDVNTAEIRVSQHRLDEAEPKLTEAMRIMRAAQFSEGISTIEIEQARICLQRDRLEDAITLSSSAAAQLELVGQHYFVLQALLVKANALVRNGDPKIALQQVDEAVGAIGDEAVHLKAKTAAVRAQAYMALGRIDEAAAEVEVGLDAAELQNLPHDQAVLLTIRHDLDEKRGVTPDPADLKQAHVIFDTLGVVL